MVFNACYKMVAKTLLKLKGQSEDFYQRSVIAICLGSAALFVTVIGGFAFNALVISVAIFSAVEFTNMIHVKQNARNSPEDKSDIVYLKRISIPYVLIPMLSIILIRESAQGRSITVWLLLSVWSIDTTSYIVGSLFGKNKLYPSISPNKTVEGALGGILAGLVTTIIFFPIMCVANGPSNDGFSFYSIVFMSLVISVSAITGDLFESYIKRQCGVKDSGHMLLSHGGIMDRVDSFTFAAPITAILSILKHGVFF